MLFKNSFPEEDIGLFLAFCGKYCSNCVLPFVEFSSFSKRLICLCMLNALTWSKDFSSHNFKEDESFKDPIFK